jgi:hypothetical protein
MLNNIRGGVSKTELKELIVLPEQLRPDLRRHDGDTRREKAQRISEFALVKARHPIRPISQAVMKPAASICDIVMQCNYLCRTSVADALANPDFIRRGETSLENCAPF